MGYLERHRPLTHISEEAESAGIQELAKSVLLIKRVVKRYTPQYYRCFNATLQTESKPIEVHVEQEYEEEITQSHAFFTPHIKIAILRSGEEFEIVMPSPQKPSEVVRGYINTYEPQKPSRKSAEVTDIQKYVRIYEELDARETPTA